MRLVIKRDADNWSAPLPPILCACGLGLLIFFSRLGDPSAEFSFDHAFHFRPKVTATNVLIITMSETAFRDKQLNPGFNYPQFNRATHASLLDKLKSGGAPVVIFDIYFSDPQPTNDTVFAEAITRHGKVILAAELESQGLEFSGSTTNDPTDAFIDLPGCTIAFVGVPEEAVARRFPLEREYHRSLPLAAAIAYGTNVDSEITSSRWMGYYGDREYLPTISYQDAMGRRPSFFTNKVVFVGGKPDIKFPGELPDDFNTPFTRWTGKKMRGVEIHATMFLNLLRHEWLTRVSVRDQVALILLVGLLFGWLFTLIRPLPGLCLLFAGAIGVSIAGIMLPWTGKVWLNWAFVGWMEIPMAWTTAALVYSRKLGREKEKVDREKESLIKELDSYKSAEHARPAMAGSEFPASHALADIKAVPAVDAPKIPDYDLIAKIDEGAYGQVWLARDLTDVYQAVKIVYRKNFSEQRPFEREFEGVKNFVTFSRSHPGCVNVRHVGKDQVGGFFYYVMEPADDLVRGPNIDPTQYVPRTLSKLLVENRVLPVLECVDLGIEVASALAALHGHRLVHRDVKPANIIFANNKPRLADIGLVARMDERLSINGTEGYMPDDHLGTPVADMFSLGRVLYVASTGCAATRHPGLPTSLEERKDGRDLMRLMEIINKACAPRYEDRYQSAAEMRDDLLKLRARLSGARV